MAVARARSTSSPSFCCSSIRRSRAFSTSLAVRACRKVIALACGAISPCSLSVSATAPTAASGTGLYPRRGDGARLCCFEGSVACARRTSEAEASIEPSACSTSRPEVRAFCTAPREMPARQAYSRSLRPSRLLVIGRSRPALKSNERTAD